MRRFHPVLLPVCLLLAACAAPSRPGSRPAGAAADDVAAIQALARAFSAAYMAGDAEAMTALYTPDAVLFPNNSEMIQGHAAIRRFWTQAPGERVTLHRITATEVRVEGDHAYDYGVYEVSGERNGQAYGPVGGKYVIVWRRGPQGWRMHLDIWNSRPRPS